ncbi:MAG: class I SAM-dependent methyltransferase [Candidatus Omnitrophota bacterium]|jgi:SAM-dependent methyltransferase|nr:class I SAM-dependent methyltransferase [Candidatus Omnitrophota bacterium]
MNLLDQRVLINKMYASKPADYYFKQMHLPGLRGAWFRARQKTTTRLVKEYFKGGIIADIGCGNCLWNNMNMPTIGIDICEPMLSYNLGNIPSFFPLKSDIARGLPLKDNSIGIVVVTELLEHFISYDFLFKEIFRVLKSGGVVIGSVPYGAFPGVWGFVFPLWCKYKVWRDKDEYYSHDCGHKIQFNAKKINLGLSDFNLLELFSLYYLTLFFVARKK